MSELSLPDPAGVASPSENTQRSEATPPDPAPRSIHPWRFWLPLAVQLLLVAIVPARSAYTFFTGHTVVLQTRPVDPYDFLRGYSQTLSYTVSDLATLAKLPGWKTVAGSAWGNGQPSIAQEVDHFYVILQRPATGFQPGQEPPAWKPVAVERQLPARLPGDRLALRAQVEGSQIIYGLESYYFPEDQARDINERLSRAGSRGPNVQRSQPLRMEVRVDAAGQAVPVALWIGKESLRF